MADAKVTVKIEGRTLALSNLDKVMYPETGFTKGEVIDYYVGVAEVLLPHLSGRILTRRRWPDGTGGQPFFEKNTPRGTPEFVRTAFMAEHGDDGVQYVVCDDVATLVWLANLAALELHVPQWRVTKMGKPQNADLVVFDLDPGAPATIVECCDVANAVRTALERDGLTAFAKTSGNKGMQLMVPIKPRPSSQASAFAKRLADDLQSALPDLVLSSMDKRARRGKVFIDWSQNNAAKTTIAPYSLRGIDRPTVSTPLTWDEVGAASSPAKLFFTAAEVRQRLAEHGDLLADLHQHRAALPKVG